MECNYVIKYPPGSLVYSIPDAKKGKLERVCTKLFNINNGVVVYTDTLNMNWIEEDLCPKDTAVVLAKEYFERFLPESE